MIKIYCLVDPRTNKPFYVGATKALLKTRLSAHIQDTVSYAHVVKSEPDRAHSKKHNLIIELLDQGLKPAIDLLYQCDTHSAEYYEQFFYSLLMIQGFKLLNYQTRINYNKYKLKNISK